MFEFLNKYRIVLIIIAILTMFIFTDGLAIPYILLAIAALILIGVISTMLRHPLKGLFGLVQVAGLLGFVLPATGLLNHPLFRDLDFMAAPTAVAVTAEGEIFVFSESTGALRLFDRDGRLRGRTEIPGGSGTAAMQLVDGNIAATCAVRHETEVRFDRTLLPVETGVRCEPEDYESMTSADPTVTKISIGLIPPSVTIDRDYGKTFIAASWLFLPLFHPGLAFALIVLGTVLQGFFARRSFGSGPGPEQD